MMFVLMGVSAVALVAEVKFGRAEASGLSSTMRDWTATRSPDRWDRSDRGARKAEIPIQDKPTLAASWDGRVRYAFWVQLPASDPRCEDEGKRCPYGAPDLRPDELQGTFESVDLYTCFTENPLKPKKGRPVDVVELPFSIDLDGRLLLDRLDQLAPGTPAFQCVSRKLTHVKAPRFGGHEIQATVTITLRRLPR